MVWIGVQQIQRPWKYSVPTAAAAKLLQSCPTLCDPIDSSPPVSPVPGILQARTLEWGATSFSNAWKWKVKVKSFSRVGLFRTPWTAAYQAPPSMGFSRQEYWSGLPLPSLIASQSTAKSSKKAREGRGTENKVGSQVTGSPWAIVKIWVSHWTVLSREVRWLDLHLYKLILCGA